MRDNKGNYRNFVSNNECKTGEVYTYVRHIQVEGQVAKCAAGYTLQGCISCDQALQNRLDLGTPKPTNANLLTT